MRIAVDVLGGDHAPSEVLQGICEALREDFAPEELLLVGPQAEIRGALSRNGLGEHPEILHAEQVVEPHESPIEALRRKPDSSVGLCVRSVREGRAAGLLSFGNTGATVAAATMGLGMLPGIRRPAIAVVLSGVGGRFLLLDAGANPSPKPRHLFQQGLMGSAYARDMLGIENPRAALLNIGGEAGKGGAVEKEAYRLLEESTVNFTGNIEGVQMFSGAADVLVTDGFVGNMIIKVVEGFAEFLVQELGGDVSLELKGGIRRILGAADYAEVGGAILLGVNGVVVIGHGRSEARAVPPALRAARDDVRRNLNLHITESLKANESAGGDDDSRAASAPGEERL